MKVSLPGFTLSTDVLNNSGSSDYLFLLHGFTGSSRDWSPLAKKINSTFNIIGIDLIGHGKSDSPDEPSLYSAPAIASQIEFVVKQFTKNQVILCGYSMGARAAISYAVNYNSSLKGLILESGTAGLKTEPEREARIIKDEEHIKFLTERPIEEFIEYWFNLPIFNTQIRFSKEKRKELLESKLINNKQGLINSLKGFGTGVMPSYWNSLNQITARTLLISGGLDSKFTDINAELSQLIPHSTHVILPSAGHNTHLEEPAKFLSVVNDFLSSFLNSPLFIYFWSHNP